VAVAVAIGAAVAATAMTAAVRVPRASRAAAPSKRPPSDQSQDARHRGRLFFAFTTDAAENPPKHVVDHFNHGFHGSYGYDSEPKSGGLASVLSVKSVGNRFGWFGNPRSFA
jgi:hypothetical protein